MDQSSIQPQGVLMTPGQVITASATLPRALATAARDVLNKHTGKNYFKLRHGEALMLIGVRQVAISEGSRLTPMTPTRYIEHFQKHYELTRPVSKADRDLLESVEMLCINPDPSDGRKKVVELTDKGWKCFYDANLAFACIATQVAEMLMALGPAIENHEQYTEDYLVDFAARFAKTYAQGTAEEE